MALYIVSTASAAFDPHLVGNGTEEYISSKGMTNIGCGLCEAPEGTNKMNVNVDGELRSETVNSSWQMYMYTIMV